MFNIFQVIELKAQIKYFQKEVETWLKRKLGKAESGLELSKAVYLFGIGTNDYMSLFLTNSPFLKSHSKSQYVELVIGNLTTSIKVSFAILKFAFKHTVKSSVFILTVLTLEMMLVWTASIRQRR